ncbi:MAG: pyridoxamine 5'-phosphate oxidase family protein [Candidatus Eremiobacteraeota bacterium]|nr:pyridoxamine 5'-phosphate oxidase family protein [Candidatus Eremiobacteraeota bacterium]
MLGQLTNLEIERVLSEEVIGRIGCSDGETPYVVPITYAYDDDAIYAHTADGLKLRLMRANPNVCFEVDHMEDPANWHSVIALGRFEELDGADAAHGMSILIERLRPLIVSETSHMHDPHKALVDHEGGRAGSKLTAMRTIVYRIELHTKTGRFERNADASRR